MNAMNAKIISLLARYDRWASMYDADYIKRFFSLYDGEMEAIIEALREKAKADPADDGPEVEIISRALRIRDEELIIQELADAFDVPREFPKPRRNLVRDMLAEDAGGGFKIVHPKVVPHS